MLVGIEELQLHPDRRDRSIPSVSGWMVDQVKQFGQLTPVVVFKNAPGSYTILKNAESWLAVQHAGLREVDILVRDDIDSEQAIEIINSGSFEDPIAEAISFRNQLQPEGEGGPRLSIAKLAAKHGVSRSKISHSLRLLSLSPKLQNNVREGLLSAGHAKVLLTVVNTKEREEIAKLVIVQSWSVRETANSIALRFGTEKANVPSAQKSPDTVRLEKKLTEDIGSQVEIDEADGKLIIDYQGNLDVLDGVLKKISSF